MFRFKDFLIASGVAIFILCTITVLCLTLVKPTPTLDSCLSNIERRHQVISILHKYNCKAPLDDIITNELMTILGGKK